MTQTAGMLKLQVRALNNSEPRMHLKTIRAFTRPIVTKLLDGP
jgi:hypothetical protein